MWVCENDKMIKWNVGWGPGWKIGKVQEIWSNSNKYKYLFVATKNLTCKNVKKLERFKKSGATELEFHFCDEELVQCLQILLTSGK